MITTVTNFHYVHHSPFHQYEPRFDSNHAKHSKYARVVANRNSGYNHQIVAHTIPSSSFITLLSPLDIQRYNFEIVQKGTTATLNLIQIHPVVVELNRLDDYKRLLVVHFFQLEDNCGSSDELH
ncbi:hypothetical protein L798_11041 [Zootermopsis nevadensis]|uniref:Uncharacterized protein n=1 Tax=Zootermopsis nevadensis TaxID=136037 RepID=A0A067RSR4_ZOONE|nr:hypothetical protein L798_11041 [Zootermopsis nevadensis]